MKLYHSSTYSGWFDNITNKTGMMFLKGRQSNMELNGTLMYEINKDNIFYLFDMIDDTDYDNGIDLQRKNYDNCA